MLVGEKLDKPCILHGRFGSDKMRWHGFLASDESSLYKCPADVDREIGGWWESGDNLGTKYLKKSLSSTDAARKAVREWEFPYELISQAKALSSRLIYALTEDKRPRVQRRQSEGRFDPMASGRMLTAIRGGVYDNAKIAPFTRTFRENPQKPHVGIIGNGNWSHMWRDATYIPRLSMLALSVAWAAEALGCLCTAAIARHIRPDYNHHKQLGAYFLAVPNVAIPLQGYAMMFHRELYRCGTLMVAHAHPFHREIISVNPSETMTNECAGEDFNGVGWMREQGASIVIVVGECKDSKKADIVIKSNTKLVDAIDEIAKRLEATKHIRGVSVPVLQRATAAKKKEKPEEETEECEEEEEDRDF